MKNTEINFCPECGSEVKGEESFCGNCGTALKTDNNVPVTIVDSANVEVTVRCPYCGEEINSLARKCKHCGEWLDNLPITNTTFIAPSTQNYQPHPNPNPQPQVVVNNYVSRSNGAGCAGFGFALLGIFTSFIPFVNFLTPIFSGIGLLLSFIGLFFRPRGLAIIGFLLSIIDVIIIISLAGALIAIFQ